jgi:hemerythrin-like domain-containing protein
MTHSDTRRAFLSTTLGLGASALTLAQTARKDDAPEEDVSPAEDLMREHGVLKRVLLIYGEALRRLGENEDMPPEALQQAAAIIRSFIEDYHEKLEEDFLFPRFVRARKLVDLVDVLRSQHQAGRQLTDATLRLASLASLKNASERGRLTSSLRAFIRMYAPHEAREDTVLFPALRAVVTAHEYGALGEDFEKKEHALFGLDGFEKMVARVEAIERRLGIFDLAQFTPRL